MVCFASILFKERYNIMKKFLSAVLCVLLMMSLAVSAFAAPSVVAPVSSGTATSAKPAVEDENAIEIVDETGKTVTTDPAEALKVVTLGDAGELTAEEQEIFNKAYEEASAVEDMVVVDFFWLDLQPEYKAALADGQGVKVTFTVPNVQPGDKVVVTVNGVQVPDEYVTVNEDGTVTVLFYEFGAVAIMVEEKA